MNPKGIPPRRVASRELPWEKPVVSANPNDNAIWRRWGTTPLGLKIARTLTQGSLADSVAGLEDTIPLGLQNQRSLRRSAQHWPRTEYPKGIEAKSTFLGSPRFHLLHHFQPLAFSLQPFFGRPHSPNNRSTRSHFGRRDGAPKYCG